MSEDLDHEIGELRGAADSAAGHTRNVYLTFILFGVYLAIIFGSTTHEQLLRETPVTLPILNVGLPLVGLYWIAPALFVLLHFNLLIQFYLLSGKLHQLDHTIEQIPDPKRRDAQRTLLYPFPFSHMLIGHHHIPLARHLLTMIVWITVVVLPVIVLIFGQAQFLPYHGFWTTWWLRFLVSLDLVLLWILWLRIVDPAGQHEAPIEFLSRVLDLDRWPGALRRLVRGSWEAKWRDWRVGLLQGLTLVAVSVSLLLVTIPGKFLAGPVDGLIGAHAYLGPLARNLSLREKELVLVLPEPLVVKAFGEEQALEKYTRGLGLGGRDLRYADLFRADLRRADLRLAELRGADLSEAQLQGARLVNADLQGARLVNADLQGANLVRAELQGANLIEAELQGANLRGAELQGANLRGAELQGANLIGAQLQGANLVGAQLQGANLIEAELQGAVLSFAQLQGAVLSFAQLQGAVLSFAQLQGANLVRAELQGAVLRGAKLQGADLRGAELQGAVLRGAHIWRVLFADDTDRDALWNLVDLSEADAEPIDIDELIASTAEGITDEDTRERVVERLEAALRGSDRTDLPNWQARPNVMFAPEDQIPQALGWDEREWATVDEYGQELATFLGNLACSEDASKALVAGLVRRALSQDDRLFSQRLAARLTPDEPDACPAATELPEDTRNKLLSAQQPGKEAVDEPSPVRPGGG